jgi:hypothetical protein
MITDVAAANPRSKPYVLTFAGCKAIKRMGVSLLGGYSGHRSDTRLDHTDPNINAMASPSASELLKLVPRAKEGNKSARSRPPAGLFDETIVAAKETTKKIIAAIQIL